MASIIKNPDYRWWLLGDALAQLASGIQLFALPLYAVTVAGSVALGGITATIGLVAMAVCALPGGVLADRVNRRILLVWQGLTGFVFGAAVVVAEWAGLMSVWVLTVLALLLGMRAGLFWSLTNTALKAVVEPEQLHEAMSANQGRDAIIGLVAAPLGGLLFGIGLTLPFAALAVLSLSTLLSAWRIRTSLHVVSEGGTFMGELMAGVRYAMGSEFLRSAIGVILLSNLAANGMIMTVVLQLQREGVSPLNIGLVEALLGLGLLVGAVLSPHVLKRFHGGMIVIVGAIWVTLTFGALVWSSDLAFVLPLMLIGGIALAPVNAVLGGYLMAIVASSIQGRVQSLVGLGGMALSSVAPMIAGIGLASAGYPVTGLIFVFFFAVMLVLLISSTAIRSIPAANGWAEAAEP